MKILIEYECSQCGAPAVLEETDRLFACEYCRVKSYLFNKDFFQYVLPSEASDSKDLFLMPYWRFKGMLFSCVDKSIEHKFIDVSYQAVESNAFPVSVGLRSQALKLKFITPDLKGYFVKPQLSFQSVMNIFMKRFSDPANDVIQYQAHVGETISIIYSPFYIDKKLYDAVLNEPIGPKLPDEFDILKMPGGKPEWSLKFIPTLCPHCGWDLNGERDALVLICTNCISAWIPSAKGLKQINFACMKRELNNTVYFPFWRIKADISGIQLASYADLVRVANLPKAIQKGWDKIDFYFWVPGFKVRPKTFLRLLSQTTTAQPMDELKTQLPDEKIFPVTLPAEEAVETLKINLASFIKNDTLLDNLPQIKIKPKNLFLAFIPFQESHHDYVQPEYQISINKNQILLSNNL
ncbi:MAG: hypothetical protein JRI53_08000 [Deltaproteobacteria bacterium]|nr:hypothetical protein [Deltaproteobacteria bacterium]